MTCQRTQFSWESHFHGEYTARKDFQAHSWMKGILQLLTVKIFMFTAWSVHFRVDYILFSIQTAFRDIDFVSFLLLANNELYWKFSSTISLTISYDLKCLAQLNEQFYYPKY